MKKKIKMRNLIIISFLLLVGFNGFGQKDTHNKDSLIFILDVVVKGVDNEKYIEGVSVKLYGSDGSEQTDKQMLMEIHLLSS